MIDYLADLESDFSRFHRVDDIHELDGPRFFRMAWRISAYGGVMAMRLEAQQHDAGPYPAETDRAPTVNRAAAPDRTNVIELAAFMVSQPDVIDRVKVGDA